ncbi:MAG TPA: hypothetical protein VMY18_13865, partial [Acidobacteriota bacterium]|nr:hypothetical protein [Acidobacteriota bacterium]
YPDQSREAESARQRLANLTAPVAYEKPHFRKIDVPTGLSLRGSGMLSPDGQKLAYISNGSLWVVPVHGRSDPNIAGTPTRLTEPMHAWDVANVSIAWSGNGKWIGFRVAVPKTDEKAKEELYMVSAEGGKPIRLPITWEDWAGDVHTLRYALSSDAEALYFADGRSLEELRIYSMPVSGGERLPLTDLPTREVALSPDGSRMTFLEMKQTSPNEIDTNRVWMQPVRGGDPVLVCEVSGKTWVRSPIWSPDGRMIAFLCSAGTSGGNRHRQVWIVPLSREGKPAAQPSKFDLPGQTSDLLAGWTKDNKIGVLLPQASQVALYTVPAVGGKASQLTPKAAWMPTWTPDGKAIFFDGVHGGDWAAIEVVPAAGGEVRRIPIDQEYEHLQPTYPSGGLSVSPDGKSICFSGFYKQGKGSAGIFTLPVEGGRPTRLSTSQPHDRIPAWSPDGQGIAFIRREQVTEDKSIWNIFMSPVGGGRAQKITTEEDQVTMASISWSPDGELIAFFGRDNTLRVVPADAGRSRILAKVGGGLRWQGISWSPDGKMLAYVSEAKLWKISSDGGTPSRIETGLDARISKIDWSPDGKTIAFSAHRGGEHELWLMEDFLPLVKTEQ